MLASGHAASCDGAVIQRTRSHGLQQDHVRHPAQLDKLPRTCRSLSRAADVVRPGPGQLRRAAPDVSARIHTPATRNRQGADHGSQYRPAIICHDTGQMDAAIASRNAQQQSLRRQILTPIAPASAFYRAEEHHQRYLEKHGHPAAQPPSGEPPRSRAQIDQFCAPPAKTPADHQSAQIRRISRLR
jgi:hypothetical protein